MCSISYTYHAWEPRVFSAVFVSSLLRGWCKFGGDRRMFRSSNVCWRTTDNAPISDQKYETANASTWWLPMDVQPSSAGLLTGNHYSRIGTNRAICSFWPRRSQSQTCCVVTKDMKETFEVYPKHALQLLRNEEIGRRVSWNVL
jgi:hypothetical protein